MDLSKVRFESLSDDERYKLFDYVLDKYGAKALGYDRTTIYRIKKRQRRVTDNMLAKILELISEAEFRQIVGNTAKLEALGILKNGVIDYDIVAAILNYASKDPLLKSMIIKFTLENMPNEIPHSITVTKSHIEKFKRYLSTKAKKTQKTRLSDLLKALEAMNYELTPEKLEDYILTIREESIHKAERVAKALKLFIKHVLKDQKLYNSFTTPKAKPKLKTYVPSLDDVVAVARAIEDPQAKLAFILLAETGLRPYELFNLTLDSIDFSARTINVFVVGEHKRAYITFIHEETRDYILNNYMEVREEFIKRFARVAERVSPHTENWRRKLIPKHENYVRQDVKEAMRRVGKVFRLYDLRSFFSTYMIKQGVSPMIVNLLQGRAPPEQFRILQDHYLSLTIDEMREIYDKYAPRVCARVCSM